MADKDLDEKKASNMAVKEGASEQKSVKEAIELVNKGPENLTPEELSKVLKVLSPFNNTNGAAGSAFVAAAHIADERLNKFVDSKEQHSPEDIDAFTEINDTLYPQKEENKQKVAAQAVTQKATFDKDNSLDSLTKESAPMIEANYNAIEAVYKDFKPYAKDDKGNLLHPEFATSSAFFDKLEISNTDKGSSVTKEDLQAQMLEQAMIQAQTDLSIDPAFQALSPAEKLKAISEAVSGNIATIQLQMIVAQKDAEFNKKNQALLTKENKTEADKAEISRLADEYKAEADQYIDQYNSGGGAFKISSAVAIGTIANHANANLSKAQRISEKTGFSKLWDKAKKFDTKMSKKYPKLWKMAKNIGTSAFVGYTTGGAGLAILAAVKTYKVYKDGKKKFKESGEAGTYWQHLNKNPKEMVTLATSAAMTAVSGAFAGVEFIHTGLDSLGALGDAIQTSSGFSNVATERAISAGTKAAIRGSISVSSSFVNAYDDIKKGNYKAAAMGIGLSSFGALGGMYLAEHFSEYTGKGVNWLKDKLGIENAQLSTETSVANGQVAEVATQSEAPSQANLNNMLLRNTERHPDLDMEKVYANLKAQGINNPEVAFYKLEQARLLAPNDPIMSEGDTNVRATLLKAMRGENLTEADMKIVSTAQSNVQDGGFYTNDVRNLGGTGYSYRPNGVVQDNTLDSHSQGGNNHTPNGTTPETTAEEIIPEAEPIIEPAFDVSKLSDNEKILYNELESRYSEAHGASATEMAASTYLAHDELVSSGKFAEAEGLLRSTHHSFESTEAKMERAEAYKVEAGDNKGLIKSKMEATSAYGNYTKSLGEVKDAEAELQSVQSLDRTDPTRIGVELKHAQAVKDLVHNQQDMAKADVDLYKDQVKHDINDAEDLQDKAKDAVKERNEDNIRISKINKELAKQGIVPNDSPELTNEYRVDKRLAKEYLKTALENKENSDEALKLLAEKQSIMNKIANGPTNQELASDYLEKGATIEKLKLDLKAINNGDISKLPGYNMDKFEDSTLAKAQSAVFEEHRGGESTMTEHKLHPAVEAPVHDPEPVEAEKSTIAQRVQKDADAFESRLDKTIVQNATVSLSDAGALDNGKVVIVDDKLGNMQLLGKDAQGHEFKVTQIKNYGKDIAMTGVDYKIELSKDHPLYDTFNNAQDIDKLIMKHEFANKLKADLQNKILTPLSNDELAKSKFVPTQAPEPTQTQTTTSVAEDVVAESGAGYNKEQLVNIDEKMRLFKAKVDKGTISSATSLLSRDAAAAEVSSLIGKSITGENALNHLEQKYGVDYDPDRNVMSYKGKVFIDPLNNTPNSSRMVIYNEGDKTLEQRGFGKDKSTSSRSGDAPVSRKER